MSESDNRNEKDRLLSSNYDGIKEYDNDLPRWWLWLFYITIAFAAVYTVWRNSSLAPTPEQRLAVGLKEIDELRAAAQKSAASGEISAEQLVALAKDAAEVSKGKEIFTTRCLPCHGQFGEGIVGPNLTDKYWIHGGKITDIRHTISEGVPDKGMITWKTMLSDAEINAVTAYVWTLRGTNPPNPKAPQGDLASD